MKDFTRNAWFYLHKVWSPLILPKKYKYSLYTLVYIVRVLCFWFGQCDLTKNMELKCISDKNASRKMKFCVKVTMYYILSSTIFKKIFSDIFSFLFNLEFSRTELITRNTHGKTLIFEHHVETYILFHWVS